MSAGSIQRRVALTTLVSTIGLLVAMSVMVYFGIRYVLTRQLDRSLLEEARLIVAMVDFRDDEVQADLARLEDGGPPRGAEESFLQIWGPDGVTLHRSRNLSELDLPKSFSERHTPTFGWARHGEAQMRCLGLTFQPRPDPDEINGTHDPTSVEMSEDLEIQLVLARRDDSVRAVLSDLLTLLGISGVLLSAGAAVLSLILARAGLRPLRGFAEKIAAIDDRSLSARLDVAATPAEITPVGERLNELLDRLEATLERERALSADIAHELRTPLASLRSTVDVALRRQREAVADGEALEDARQATRRLQGLVDRLLWLVRLDAGTVDIEVQPTELTTLLQETWRPLKSHANARKLQVDWDLPEEVQVSSDPMLTGIVLRNLLENAVAYADEGGRVGVRVTRRGDRAAIEVTNSGSQVRQEDVPGLLRRFTRGDRARTLVGSRCGLGLALVDRIAEALGHHFEIRTRPGGTFEVSLSMGAA